MANLRTCPPYMEIESRNKEASKIQSGIARKVACKQALLMGYSEICF